MPLYTIEATYRLPVYRQRTYEATTSEAACELAIADEGWGDGKEDVETSGETYVTGIWKGRTAYAGTTIAVPDRFDETIQRKADFFDDLLALLKEPARPMGLSRHEFEHWLPRAMATIAKADAIVADAARGR
ncbi:hypothetical protein [Mesorhizobium xinjiangense]|uniref:hypothetical protein n=1 Tax=Mesorhizobium xinjiangense TaxID=2678685 RepID=UPI0012EE2D85|nr:hypothetical protein [Mesorhizobium xinjiangense]